MNRFSLKIFQKNKGFSQLLSKSLLWVAIVIIVNVVIGAILNNTQFFIRHLTIPQALILEAPNMKMTMFNAFIFGLAAFLIFIHKSDKIKDLHTFKYEKYQRSFIVLAVLLLIAKYYYFFLIHQNPDYFLQTPLFWGGLKTLFNLTIIAAICFSIFSFKHIRYLVRRFKRQFIWFIILSVVFFFLMLLVQNLWSYFASAISSVLYHAFNLFFTDVVYKPFQTSFTMAEGGGPVLGIHGFNATMGKPCSGIDSFLLFTALYALIYILDHQRMRTKRAALFFVIGAAGMFLTNVLRIILLFMVGAYISPKFAVSLFHTNIGWILFALYFFVFWAICSKHLYADRKIMKKH
jgi:exosortase/archaeosortase family protein